MRSSPLLFALLLSLAPAVIVGCQKETRDTVKENAKAAGTAIKQDAKDTVDDVKDAAKGAIDKGKEAFIAAAIKELDAFDRSIDKMAEKAKNASAKARDDVQKLRELSAAIRQKVEKLKELPGDAWRAVAEDIVKDLDKLRRAKKAAEEEMNK